MNIAIPVAPTVVHHEDPEILVLCEAWQFLDAKATEIAVAKVPTAFFRIVLHARDHVDHLISDYLKEEAR